MSGKMDLQTKKILRINVTVSSDEKILEEIRKYLKQFSIFNFQFSNKRVKPFIIFTPNPEIISFAQKDDNFVRIVNTAQINLPDGAGVVWAMKKLYGVEIKRIAGIDFLLKLVNLAEVESLTIGLIGGRGDLADVTAECLLSKHKNLKIEVFEEPEVEIQNSKLKIEQEGHKNTSGVARWTPPMVEESENRYFNGLVSEIEKRKITILFVALGHPKQEYFIENIKYQISNIKYNRPLVLMAVGGAFDYISGRVPRAPLVIRNLGLEWLFRLIWEPWRFPRQLKGAEFFWRVLSSTPGVERD